jgi:23S rRNA G2445 N2-methylase RlmL
MQRKVVLNKKSASLPSGIASVSILAASCAGGLEAVLSRELEEFGYPVAERRNGLVYFSGTIHDLPGLSASLRIASRLFVPLITCSPADHDQLYREAQRIPWEEIIPVDATFSISSSTASPIFTDHRFLAMRLKDAIVDRQRTRSGGKRSSVSRDRPQVIIAIHAGKKDVVISLDATGAPLHERGYRTEAGEAPLRETLAAGMVLLAWKDAVPSVLVDPFCGSGTIAIEAALIAARRPPGDAAQRRRRYQYSRWPWFPRSSGASPQLDTPRTSVEIQIIAADHDPAMVELAQRNAERAGVAEAIQFHVAPFSNLANILPMEQDGTRKSGIMMISNPPWGTRLKPEDIGALYHEIRKTIHHEGINSWILSGEPVPRELIPEKPRQRFSLFNGGLQSQFINLQLP